MPNYKSRKSACDIIGPMNVKIYLRKITATTYYLSPLAKGTKYKDLLVEAETATEALEKYKRHHKSQQGQTPVGIYERLSRIFRNGIE